MNILVKRHEETKRLCTLIKSTNELKILNESSPVELDDLNIHEYNSEVQKI